MNVSIGIFTCNEANIIEEKIRNVFDVKPKDADVYVITDGNQDSTLILLDSLKSKYDITVLATNKRRGKSEAVNVFYDNCDSDILILSDGDTIIKEGAIDKMLRHFKDEDVGVVGGRPIPILNRKNNLVESWYRIAYEWWAYSRQKEQDTGTFYMCSGNLMAVRRTAFYRIPTWMLIDDAYLSYMAYVNAWKVVYDQDAKVFFSTPKKIWHYMLQKKRIQGGWMQIKSFSNGGVAISYTRRINYLWWMFKRDPSLKNGFELFTYLFFTKLAVWWGAYSRMDKEVDGKWPLQKTPKELF